MSSPLVSIIIATYNRSNVLALAIESVRWQTFPDWELWVVGDACTDDTEHVVASFAEKDARIHFFNLEENVGEQSGPNNVGARRARGRYIAYLNHDDLWLPDHLETLVGSIETMGVDLVFSLLEIVQRDEANVLMHTSPLTDSDPPAGCWDPPSAPASCWLVRREMIEELGEWPFYQECFFQPSQEWLFRAWRAGKKLRMVPRLTGVAIQSAGRPGSYADRQIEEHRHYFDRLVNEPDFRARELAVMGFADESAAIQEQRRRYSEKILSWGNWKPIRTLPRRIARHGFFRGCVLMGIHPLGAMLFLRYFRTGAGIDQMRQVRGLPALKRKGRGRGT